MGATMAKRTGKVAIIGAGFVGSTAAYALLIEGAASEITLIDRHLQKAEGEAMDLRHGLQFRADSRVTYGTSYSLNCSPCSSGRIPASRTGLPTPCAGTRRSSSSAQARTRRRARPAWI